MKERIKSVVLTANIIEWYDYIVFAFLARQIAINFFPNDSKLGVFKALAIFAITYIARPVGAMVFGSLADRYGIKKIIPASMLLVCVPAGLVTILPSATSIGFFAPVILMLLRLLQSFGMGAEYPLTARYAYLYSHPDRKIYNTGLSAMSATAGMIIGSAAVDILSFLSAESMNEWGWRICFALTIPGSIYIYRLRSTVMMTVSESAKTVTEKRAISHVLPLVLIGLLIVGLAEAIFYTSRIYMPTYLINFLHASPEHAHFSNTLSMLFIAFLILPCCYYSQKKGVKTVMLSGAIFFLIASVPLYLLITQNTLVLVSQLLLAAGTVGFGVCNFPLLSQLFGRSDSSMGLCLAYTLGVGVISGPSILLADYLVRLTNDVLMPAYLVTGYALALLLVVKTFFPEATAELTSQTQQVKLTEH